MSGHSKWSTIRRKKGALDAKRGALFTKLSRELTLAAKEGGGDPEDNFHLRLVVEKCKQANMPKDNIERAIKRGTGELKGAALEEIMYEGYGPHGIAVLVDVVTDNRNRAVADVRRTFTRLGGNLGANGSVAWLFDRKGYIAVEPDDMDLEEIALLAIDAGADDVTMDERLVEVYTAVEDFQRVQEALRAEALELTNVEIAWLPKTTMQLDEKGTIQAMNLVEALEDSDDVRQVYSNLDIPDDIMDKYEQAA